MKWKTGVQVPPELHKEVKANKATQKTAVKHAKQANKQLKQLLDENHFTLYLAVAAGARLKPKGA